MKILFKTNFSITYFRVYPNVYVTIFTYMFVDLTCEIQHIILRLTISQENSIKLFMLLIFMLQVQFSFCCCYVHSYVIFFLNFSFNFFATQVFCLKDILTAVVADYTKNSICRTIC